MSDLTENDMSNGEVLAAVNKIHNQKSRNLKNFPKFLNEISPFLKFNID
jgi:hypothetical protein